MPEITISMLEELQKKMQRHSEMKWSEIARQTLERKADEIEFMGKVLESSELAEGDTLRIGHSINDKLTKRLRRNRG